MSTETEWLAKALARVPVRPSVLVNEVYGNGNKRQGGRTRYPRVRTDTKKREVAMQPQVHQRPIDLPNWAQNVKHDLPPIVHAPCERRPFDPDVARLQAYEYSYGMDIKELSDLTIED